MKTTDLKRMSEPHPYPRTGIALIMTHHKQVLIGRRKNSPMINSWQLPGGWLHHGESPQGAVRRIQQQFSGIVCQQEEFVAYTNNVFENGLHSVSLYFKMACVNADLVDLQQNQDCSDWIWADWYDLPKSLFMPLAILKRSDYSPFRRDL